MLEDWDDITFFPPLIRIAAPMRDQLDPVVRALVVSLADLVQDVNKAYSKKPKLGAETRCNRTCMSE
jgi:hypothetical protein